MIDAHNLELIATGASLAADFMKARLERGESFDTDAFQQWLQREAFPHLLAQSDQTLRSLISLKASQHERYEELLDHVVAIRHAVVDPTPADKWSALSEIDRCVLKHVYEKARENPFQPIDSKDLESALIAVGAVVASSARYLSERGLLKLAAGSDGWSVAPQGAGVHLAWAVADAQGYDAAIDRLGKALPARGETKRLATLAAEANVPAGLTYFVMGGWADQGFLTLQDNASPYDRALIHNVRETFLRSISDRPT